MESPPNPLEGVCGRADTLILDFSLGDNKFLLFKPPSLWYLVMGQPEETNTGPYTSSGGEAEMLNSARLSELPGAAEASGSAKRHQSFVNSLN